MKSMIKSLLFCAALFASTEIFATNTDHQLHGKRATPAEAKQLSLSFVDGTNVMLVNWSHYAVDVDVPLLGESVDLGPITTDYNAYYLYSPFYYSYVTVYLYDCFTGLHIATVAADNPSTVEIWDSYFASTSKTQEPKQRINVKHGL